MVCVDATLLQVNVLEAMDVVRINWLAAGAPVPDARLSNPALAGVLVAGAGNAIVAVIVPPVAAVADIERNCSLFIVVVEVTYSAGMVYVARKVSFVVAAPSRGDGGARAVSSTQTLSPGGVPQLGRPRFSSP